MSDLRQRLAEALAAADESGHDAHEGYYDLADAAIQVVAKWVREKAMAETEAYYAGKYSDRVYPVQLYSELAHEIAATGGEG